MPTQAGVDLTRAGRLLRSRTVDPSQGRDSARRLVVVFVSYNSSLDLDRALGSLVETTPDGMVKAVVVENGADVEATRVVCEHYGSQLLIPERNLGYGLAANLVGREVRGEYFAVSNPDVVFLPDTIRLLLDFMDGHPDAGVVAPQFLYPDGTPQPSARRKPSLRYVLAGRRSPFVQLLGPGRRAQEFLYAGSEQSPKPIPVEAVVGTLMLFRRRAFLEVGGFDSDYFMFAEDIDICLRLAPRWSVYLLPQAQLVHAVGSARKNLRIITEFHRLRSLRRLFLRSYGRMAGIMIGLGFACYLGVLMWLALFGVGEREHTWQSRSRT